MTLAQLHGESLVGDCLASLPYRVPANDNSPSARRRILESWRASAPRTDGEIFSRKASSAAPRMAKTTEFAGLMVWKRLREASESDGVGSNWLAASESHSADNDNEPQPVVLVECAIKEDSAEALLRRLGDYTTTDRWDVILHRDDAGLPHVAERRVSPTISGQSSGQFERYRNTRFRKKPRSRTFLSAPGGLRRCGIAVFSGPEHRGRGDEPKTRIGTLGYLARSGAFVPLEMEWDYVERTSSPPPTDTVLDAETIFDARRRMGRLLSVLGERDVLALDTALRAENFAEMGRALGYVGTYAPKAARRALAEACADLQEALMEFDE